MLVAN